MKKPKERLTLLLRVSMVGEKMDLLIIIIIGKHINTRGLKDVNLSALHLQYVANESAWMTTKVFTKYLEE